MKKVFLVFMSLMFIMCLAGCGEKEEKINCICSVCGIGRPAYKGNNIPVSAGHKSYRKSTAYTNGIKSGAVGVI